MIVRNSVDLPTPLRPEHREAAIRRHLERDAVERRRLAVSGAHVLQHEQGLSHGGPAQIDFPTRGSVPISAGVPSTSTAPRPAR